MLSIFIFGSLINFRTILSRPCAPYFYLHCYCAFIDYHFSPFPILLLLSLSVTAGTSELSDIGSCFLQIKFVVLKDGEKVSQLVEMTLPQFYSFLSSMQKAANAVEQAQ